MHGTRTYTALPKIAILTLFFDTFQVVAYKPNVRNALETCTCPLSGGTALRNSHAAHCAHCLPTHDAPRRSTSGTSGGPRASSPPPPSLLTYDVLQALLRTRLSKRAAAGPSLDPPRSLVAHPLGLICLNNTSDVRVLRPSPGRRLGEAGRFLYGGRLCTSDL